VKPGKCTIYSSLPRQRWERIAQPLYVKIPLINYINRAGIFKFSRVVKFASRFGVAKYNKSNKVYTKPKKNNQRHLNLPLLSENTKTTKLNSPLPP